MAEVWMNPVAHQRLMDILDHGWTRDKASVTDLLSLTDDLAERATRAYGDHVPDFMALRPVPLKSLAGYFPTGWAATQEGAAIAARDPFAHLLLYQIDRVRSIVAILESGSEVFVVVLAADLTGKPRASGFLSDEDAVLAEQWMRGELGKLLDLSWLEDT